ncbi:Uu.00g004600.m01.CDS01 [Anthostomella pinea]|uniref:Uu.00g004600.m01.CDS01 n=1 Tax=Anthostomella pinea TaxID=933095 RepID=A0AAI8YIT7_9PEZI|nr:Uu.00g004600.m01.CDS01 [Anthostomella pinea]
MDVIEYLQERRLALLVGEIKLLEERQLHHKLLENSRRKTHRMRRMARNTLYLALASGLWLVYKIMVYKGVHPREVSLLCILVVAAVKVLRDYMDVEEGELPRGFVLIFTALPVAWPALLALEVALGDETLHCGTNPFSGALLLLLYIPLNTSASNLDQVLLRTSVALVLLMVYKHLASMGASHIASLTFFFRLGAATHVAHGHIEATKGALSRRTVLISLAMPGFWAVLLVYDLTLRDKGTSSTETCY